MHPRTSPQAAAALSRDFAIADPGHKAEYDERLSRFNDSLKPLNATVAELRAKYAGTPVTATEPVFGYMASALGLKMRNEHFQLAIMNDTEPSPSDVAAFEADLRGHKVNVLLYNTQANSGPVKRLLHIAEDVNIPVVGVSEMEPAGTTYQSWMMNQLNMLNAALGKPRS